MSSRLAFDRRKGKEASTVRHLLLRLLLKPGCLFFHLIQGPMFLFLCYLSRLVCVLDATQRRQRKRLVVWWLNEVRFYTIRRVLVGTSATFDPVVPSLCSFFLLHPIDPCVPPTSARLLLASLSADVSFIPFALPWLLQPNLSDRFFLPLVSSAFFLALLYLFLGPFFVCVCSPSISFLDT